MAIGEMKFSRKAALGGVLLLVLAACSEPTAYAPADGQGNGYATRAVEQDRFVVTFSGNSLTSKDTVESYLLYRAAEVTLEAGGDWFRVAERDTETVTRYRSTGTSLGTGLNRYHSNIGGFATVGTTGLRPVRRFEASANVQVFNGNKPRNDPQAYDARSVLRTLGPTIQRPAA